MLETLRTELKNLIAASKQKEVFRRLQEEVLATGSELFNTTTLICARWAGSERDDNLGTIRFADKDFTFNNVNKALLWLIDRIEISDLNTDLRQGFENIVAVPASQRLTCDRVDQTDQIQIDYYNLLEESTHKNKVQFYYLHGDSRQEHQSFFKRVSLELSAHLDNWKEGEAAAGARIEVFDCKPKTSRNPVILRMNIMRELMGYFFKPLNQQQPILKKKLADLLASPKLKGFKENDFVFILITTDEHNWDKKIIPTVIKRLYYDFLQRELPPNSPYFYFFFGLEYRQGKDAIKQEVQTALDAAEHGTVLPELTPLELDDISEWLSRYEMLLPSGTETHEYAEHLFPSQNSLDMLDVELKLKQIIENHNKGFTILNKKT